MRHQAAEGCQVLDFNSIKVRLERLKTTNRQQLKSNFNSIKVRLEREHHRQRPHPA